MWLWLALIICFLAGAAQAQVARVLTGEHEDFTRVVVNIPAGADWQLGRTDLGYGLRVPGVAGYDLSGFFDLIPQDRIRSVSEDPRNSQMTLEVVCPCTADAYLFRPTFLVIDISDGLPGPEAAFEAALNPPVLPEPRAPALPLIALREITGRDIITPEPPRPGPVPGPFDVTGNTLLPLVIPRQNTAAAPVAAAAPNRPAPAEATASAEEPAEAADTAARLAALEAAIVTGLAQGLTEGALESARNLPDDPADDALAELNAALAGLALPGITARTGADPLAQPDRAPPALAQDGRACLPDAYFNVADWGADEGFFDQINAARRALLGEFDRPDEEAVTALARLYVYFGFGREARQVLTLDGLRGQERRYLDALARIMDRDPLPDGLFAAQVSCPGPVALWAMMADETPPFDATVDRVAVLRQFKLLPQRLQVHLGPRLSNKFILIGDTDAALQVLDTAQSQPDPSIEVALADATLSEALGAPEAAIATVTSIAREDPRATPAAMTRFFEDGIEAGVQFTDADFLTADSLRFETTGTPEATALAAAQARAYLAMGRFDASDALITETADNLSPEVSASLTGALVSAATTQMTDGRFLEFIWSRDISALPASLQTPVAARLTDLGFPARAEGFLTAPATAADLTAQRFEQARAALAQGAVEAALAFLDDDDSAAARALRAAAMATRDGQIAAAQIAEGLDGVPLDNARALLATPPAQDLPDLAALDAAVTTAEPVTLDPETPLTQSRDLLDRSAETRALLDQMLSQFETPDPDSF